MVDRNARKILAMNLAALMEGGITTCQFFDSKPRTEHDRAIIEIWQFGDCLYSDISEYRLTGQYTVDRKTHDLVQQCILFLSSDLEYMWPDYPGDTGIELFFASLITGILSGVAIPLKLFVLVLPLFGASFLLLTAYLLYSKYKGRKREALFWKHGDKNTWPFLNQRDLENIKVNQKGTLLRDSDKTIST